jgi:hypothetical protein
MEKLLIILFIFWFFVTLFSQFRWFISNQIRSYDFFSLVPSWTFFAPNPGTVDYRIVCKITKPDHYVQHHLINTIVLRNNLIYSIWNPNKRRQKVLVDVVQSFVRFPVKHSSYLPITVPYLLLFNFLANIFANEPKGSQLQFLIYESRGVDSLRDQEVIFVSDCHTL